MRNILFKRFTLYLPWMTRENFSLQYQYNIKHRSDENKVKYQLGDCYLIKYQILQIDIITIVWQTVRRITNEILGVTGLRVLRWTTEIRSWPCYHTIGANTVRYMSGRNWLLCNFQLHYLTLYTLTSVCIFSILLSIHFLRCWQGEFV